MLLAGGDIGQVGWNSPYSRLARQHWQAAGGTHESFVEALKEIDPVTYADRLKGRDLKMLMLNVHHDEIIPKACTESLWRAFGKPEIVWWDAGHKSCARFMFDGLARVTLFFQSDAEAGGQ